MLSEEQNKAIASNSVYSTLTTTSSNVLEKGLLDDFNSAAFDITKTGAEIKEKLKPLLDRYIMKKRTSYEKLIECKSHCVGEPVEKPPYHLIAGFEDKINPMPKMYSWEQIQSLGSYETSLDQANPFTNVYSQMSDNVSSKQSDQDSCRKYNEKVREYIHCCIEICKMQTLYDNLLDNQKLTLSVRQASILGF